MAATKEQIRQAAMEMHGWMQQRAIARLQGELPARSQSKVGVRSEEREEMLRRFPQFTREDRSKVVKITATSQSSDSWPQQIQRRLV